MCWWWVVADEFHHLEAGHLHHWRNHWQDDSHYMTLERILCPPNQNNHTLTEMGTRYFKSSAAPAIFDLKSSAATATRVQK